MSERSVGIIGLGSMGRGMAAQLLRTGWQVSVWNRTADVAGHLVAAGATQAATPAAAVNQGGLAVTMLANDAALELVCAGDDGIVAGLGKGGVHVSMSTISVALARSLADRHTASGSAWVAAPVFGRPDAAGSGRLWVLVSGDAAAKARARPLFDSLSQGVFDIGEEPDAAPAGKIAGNFLIASAMEAMSEAFALLQKRGVDARVFHDMMSKTLFAAPVY